MTTSFRFGCGLLSQAAFLMILLGTLGCAHPHHARPAFIIPARCVGIKVQSFTEPCTQLADGKLVCNGVIITANCVQKTGEK